MKFEELLKHCDEHPNGTYDLVPYVDAHKREVRFEWGNSLRLAMDPETKALALIVGRVFTDVHPTRIQELLLHPRVRASAAAGGLKDE